MPSPGSGRKPYPAKPWARAPESACTWLMVLLGYGRRGCWGLSFSQEWPQVQQGASGEPALGQVGPSTFSARNPGLSLGSPSRDDVGGKRRPARPEREGGGLSAPGGAEGRVGAGYCSGRLHPWTPGTPAGTGPELVSLCLARACRLHCTPAAMAPRVPSSPLTPQCWEAGSWSQEETHPGCLMLAKGISGVGGPEIRS